MLGRSMPGPLWLRRSESSRTALLALVVVAAPLYTECAAQVTTDGSLGPRQTVQGPNFTIDSTLGQLRGTNLFHSFGRFNVQTGESATFTNTPGSPVSNVLSRVTGGERSFIDGLIRSSIPGANLYLLNPSGIMFGPNATLDVSGAFHVSTADYLRLGDGAVFHARLQNNSVLTAASPVAFGFLTPSPAGISFDHTTLAVPQGQTLSVVGGDIQMTGGTLRTASGRLNLASVASAGEFVPSAAGLAPDVDVSSFARLGQIQLSQGASATVSSDAGAGTMLIRGGRLVVDSGASLNANTLGVGNSARLGIDIRTTGDVMFKNGAAMLVLSFGSGSAADARIAAAKLQVNNGAFISAGVNGSGAAGNLAIDVGALEVRDGGFVNVATSGLANGGNLDVTAGHVLISNTSPFFTGLFSGQFNQIGRGHGGTMTVNAGSMTIIGSPLANNTNTTGISAFTSGFGNAGRLVLNVAGDVSITGTSELNSFTGIFGNAFGTGTGGHVQLTAGNLTMTQRGSIFASSLGPGDAGSIQVNTGRLEISSGSSIAANALFGSGNAGSLAVNANNVLIKGVRTSTDPMTSPADFTGLSTATGFTGKRGGDLSVQADTIDVTDKGAITSLSVGAGDAGNIRIEAGNLSVTGQAQISSSSLGTGRGGNIDVRANSVTVAGAGAPLGPSDNVVSGIASEAGLAGGAAGDVTIKAETVQVLDGAKVSTETFGAGKGGNLFIDAASVRVSGINSAYEAYLKGLPGHDVQSARSAILSSSQRALLGDNATGDAGNIRITGGAVQFDAGGMLASTTDTPGAGGSIALAVDSLKLAGGALISAQSSTSSNAGKSGDISITARGPVEIAASSITTTADHAAGGDITLAAKNVRFDAGALVSARSSGTGTAGNITIVAEDSVKVRGSVVSTEAVQADGGNIAVLAPSLIHLTDSRLSTSVGNGSGRGGNISIDPDFVILDRSQIRADASGGPGGNISIVADVFLTQDSVLSASSALSAPGTIDVQARVTDVSGNVTRLPESATPAAALLRASCAARLSGGSISSLVVAGREGLPPGPEGLLPSPLIVQSDPAATRLLQDQRIEPLPRISLALVDRSCSGFSVR